MKKNNVIATTLIVACITIIAKFIGFGREAIIAAYYGATKATDAYFLARNMPALLFPAVCSSISTAFLSVYVTKSSQQGIQEGDFFASKALNITLIISFLLSIVAFIVAPIITPIFAPGFDIWTLRLAIRLTRITMAAFSITMLQYMLTAILNSKKFFYRAQIAGVLNNLFIISMTLLFGKNQSVDFLTWIVVGGLFIQVVTLLSFTKKRFNYRFDTKIIDSDIKKMLKLSIPILLGNSVVQLSTIVDKILASKLMEGAVSSLSYTNSLNSVVTSVFIVSLSTVLYPTLTENASNKDEVGFSKNLLQNLLLLVMIIVPISMIATIFSSDIIKIVYMRGEFDQTATQLTTDALTYYAIGYVFIAVREIIIRGFYAVGDSKTPMVNGFISVGLNIVFSIALSTLMGIKGIALGTSIAAGTSAVILLKSINYKMNYIKFSNVLPTIKKILIASFLTFVLLLIISKYLTNEMAYLRFGLATMLGLPFYLLVLLLLKCDELQKLKILLLKKIRREKSQ